MRCPDCNKFVAFNTDADPDVDLTVSDDGVVTGTMRIMNACEECGTELTEATLEPELDLSEAAQKHVDEKHPDHPDAKGGLVMWDLEVTSQSRTDRSEGSGRRPRRYYGAEAEVEITCRLCENTDDPFSISGTVSEEVQASGMEPLV